MEMIPKKVNPSSLKFKVSCELRLNFVPLGYSTLGKCILANPSTLSPFFPQAKLTYLNLFVTSSVTG